MVEKNDNIQQRDEDNNKMCRRYNKENREDCVLLGGYFNGGIGKRGARNWEEERGDGKRKSKDKVENAERKD
jgi:hypothetical protein